MTMYHSRAKIIIMRTNPFRCYRWPKYVGADLMAKVWLTVIIQIKQMGDALGMIWLQVVSSEKCYFGVGVILSQSYCYGYHDYDCNIYFKLLFY